MLSHWHCIEHETSARSRLCHACMGRSGLAVRVSDCQSRGVRINLLPFQNLGNLEVVSVNMRCRLSYQCIAKMLRFEVQIQILLETHCTRDHLSLFCNFLIHFSFYMFKCLGGHILYCQRQRSLATTRTHPKDL